MKNTSLWIRTVIILGITLVGIYLVFGPRHTPTSADLTWQGIKTNLANNINLGLDLKGGSHLVMRVKTEDYLKNLTTTNEVAAVQAAKDAKDDNGQTFPVGDGSYVAENGNYAITVNVGDPEKAQAVADAIKKKVDFVNWTQSINGGAITWTLPKQMQGRLKEQATDQALKIIESRINSFGVKEAHASASRLRRFRTDLVADARPRKS
jgi:preprotein translocase subunit SecD